MCTFTKYFEDSVVVVAGLFFAYTVGMGLLYYFDRKVCNI